MLDEPLKGLKVLELASVLAGPAVGTFLAELGAEVIKVENPGTKGDVTRSWKLPAEDPNAETSAYFASVNYGKNHRFLDLRNEAQLQEVKQLAQEADIVIANFRKGQAQRFGLDADALRKHHQTLIYANINGFGPDDDRPAYDVVLQAEAGYMFMNGQPDSIPTKMPVALIDVLAAHQLKEAILLALYNRQRTGNGAVVEVSLFDAAISALSNQASNWLMNGHVPQRIGSLHPNIAPYGELLTTSDGRQIVLAVGSDKQFAALCSVLGLSELVNDQRFNANQKRVANRHELHRALQAKAGQFTTQMLMQAFADHAIPAGVVRNLEEVFGCGRANELVRADGEMKRVSQIAFKFNA